jgi:hypothetical protein
MVEKGTPDSKLMEGLVSGIAKRLNRPPAAAQELPLEEESATQPSDQRKT